jgi:hypothetical protein
MAKPFIRYSLISAVAHFLKCIPTVWLNIDQIAELFQKSRSTINEHILNIYKEEELEKEPTMRKIGKTISDCSVLGS